MLYGEHTSRLLYGGQRGDSHPAVQSSSSLIIVIDTNNTFLPSAPKFYRHTQLKGENVSMIKLAEFWVRPGYGGQFRRGGH